ncbi:hypothetical protein FD754_000244, partial [Muntiacus muntjak]
KVLTWRYTDSQMSTLKFVFFNVPQIQYKNPWVQVMLFKNMTPTPFLRFYLGEETLRREQQEREQLSHPAHFGPRKYCLRECICEVEGQVPCPAVVPLPRELTGKFQAALRAGAQD